MIFWTNIKFGVYKLNDDMITISFDEKMVEKVKECAEAFSVSQNEVFRRAIIYASANIEDKLKQNVSGPILKVVTGRLRQSIGSKVEWNKNEVKGTIGSGVRTGNRVVYADILEKGGVIKPKRAKFLTIPIGENKTKTEKIAYRARDFENTFIRKGIIFQNLGKGNIRPLFLLKSAVTIPDFEYMGQTASQSDKIVEEAIEQAIEQTKRELQGKK